MVEMTSDKKSKIYNKHDFSCNQIPQLKVANARQIAFGNPALMSFYFMNELKLIMLIFGG